VDVKVVNLLTIVLILHLGLRVLLSKSALARASLNLLPLGLHFLQNDLLLALLQQEPHNEEASDDQDRDNNDNQNHNDEVVIIRIVDCDTLNADFRIRIDSNIILNDRQITVITITTSARFSII